MGTKIKTDVIVIGGGATGTGILRDLALRGIDAVLVEQQDLANGTSSRYHGLLHSGARYAVNDKNAASECYQENLIIGKTIPEAVEKTGGLFVKLPQDDDEYHLKWIKSCQEINIPVEEIPVAEALKIEPYINKNADAVYRVPDAAVDGFTMIGALANDAISRGSRVLRYHQVIGMIINKNRVEGITVRDLSTNEKIVVYANIIVNAAGPWINQVAQLAGVDINLVNNRGMLAVFNRRFNQHVINRLRKPSDSDIFVPSHDVTIFGTTGINVDNVDHDTLDRAELIAMLKVGKELIPDIEELRLIRAFVGVRPLYQEEMLSNDDGRNLSRDLALLDHSERDGLDGLITITGGKFTTFRYMAEKTVDLVCEKLNINTKCTTDKEIVSNCDTEGLFKQTKIAPVAKNKLLHLAEKKASQIEKKLAEEDILNTVICECEQVTLGEVESALTDNFNLNDIRRRTRLGMGTCQGTYCLYRAAIMETERGITTAEEAEKALMDALREREKGMKVVAIGESAKQLELMKTIYSVSLGMKRGDEENV